MTKIDVVENRISAIRKYLDILSRFSRYSPEEIRESIELTGALERYLYLACQSSIDLADAMISLKNLRKPATLGESFRILEEAGIIDKDLCSQLVRMAGFRNVLAHDYVKVEFDLLFQVYRERIGDLNNFLHIAASVV